MEESKYPHLLSPESTTYALQSNVPIFHVTSLNKNLQLYNEEYMEHLLYLM